MLDEHNRQPLSKVSS